jgi:hypothetical protein
MKSVITLAVGKQVYIDMAVALARSFYIWNKDAEIDFYIATDNKKLIASDVLQWAKMIVLRPGELGEGFSAKLYLDKIAPTEKTLFIDSDCLIVKPLIEIFTKMEGRAVSVVGSYINEGEWFGDVKSVCERFGLDKIPKFNGGLYYIEKGEIATKVYNKARELEPQYDEIGLERLRNKPNDELLMALAMALYNQPPLEDTGNYINDPQACPGKFRVSVFKGHSLMTNPTYPHPLHQSWNPNHIVYPVILHFLGYYTNKYPYIHEAEKLRLVFEKKINRSTAAFISFFRIALPFLIKGNLKKTFRPIYHFLFGYRKIKQSNRI